MEVSPSLNTLIFDFDGTLFELDIDWQDLRNQVGIAGNPRATLGDVMQQFMDTNDAKLEIITQTELKAVGDKRVEGLVIEALQKLSKNYHMAIFTRNSRRAVERAFEGLNPGVELYIVGREDVSQLKPNPEGIETILNRFGAEPAQAAMIGDTVHDIEVARRAGVTSIIVRNERLAYQPKGADHYIQTIADLPLALNHNKE